MSPFDPERRRCLAAAAAVAAVGPMAGCSRAGLDHDGEAAPVEQPLAGPAGIAWVFSSGGPRGFQHVGVLKALHELQLQPDLIVGASIGALIGVLRAGGLAPSAIEALALELQPWSLVGLSVGSDAWLNGEPLADLVRSSLPPPARLEQLVLPVACVAARARDGAITAFTAGDAGVAVMASTAIEGQFAPVRIRGESYVDPDLHMPMPVRVARRLGARRVLAVDASAHEDRAPPDIGEYLQGDLRKRALTQPDAALADLVIHPDPGYWAGMSREYRLQAIEAGYRATLQQADALKALHAEASAPAPHPLAGTQWQLVAIQSMDDAQGTTRVPDPSRYTLALGSDGRATLRVDCNRGSGTWASSDPATPADAGSLRFGPLAVTKRLCPPPTLHDRVLRDLPFVRGWRLQGGRLHLSLMADAGIYTWQREPMAR